MAKTQYCSQVWTHVVIKLICLLKSCNPRFQLLCSLISTDVHHVECIVEKCICKVGLNTMYSIKMLKITSLRRLVVDNKLNKAYIEYN